MSKTKSLKVKTQNAIKRVVVIADTHCGHIFGLTPKYYQMQKNGDSRWNKAVELQHELWDWFVGTLKSLQPIHLLIANGDMIDGTGHRSGSTEQITTDRIRQAKMACECINKAQAAHVVVTYGTSYHTGDAEDMEEIIVDRVGADKIGSHEWPEVNGVIFDVKHYLGSSSIPHGRHTAISRDRLWNVLWAERGEQPKAQIFIRSHVHYFQAVVESGWMGMTTPALQCMGTKYGARRCSGHVEVGLVSFDIDQNGKYSWETHIAQLEGHKAKTQKF